MDVLIALFVVTIVLVVDWTLTRRRRHADHVLATAADAAIKTGNAVAKRRHAMKSTPPPVRNTDDEVTPVLQLVPRRPGLTTYRHHAKKT